MRETKRLRGQSGCKSQLTNKDLFLSVAETAEVLGVSEITVKRHWRVAKAWLYDKLSERLKLSSALRIFNNHNCFN